MLHSYCQISSNFSTCSGGSRFTSWFQLDTVSLESPNIARNGLLGMSHETTKKVCKKIGQIFRWSHIVSVIFRKCTFYHTLILLEILHLMVQKSCQKSNCKAKYKVKKILFYDSGTFSENISHFDQKSMDVL